jgi:hypothetical protein
MVPVSRSIQRIGRGSSKVPLAKSPLAVADAPARPGATAEQFGSPIRPARHHVPSLGSSTLNAGSVLVSSPVVEED